jgi:site-specific DNA-cytosine methylase
MIERDTKLQITDEPAIAYSTCYRQYGINVLSFFDGISCGQIALEKAGHKVNKYFACEIKPHAIKCTNNNYPKTIQLGDVRNVHYTKIGIEVDLAPSHVRFIEDDIHLFLAGSPCKGISRLNKNQEGLEHDESKLFYEAVRVLREIQVENPDVYLTVGYMCCTPDHKLLN